MAALMAAQPLGSASSSGRTRLHSSGRSAFGARVRNGCELRSHLDSALLGGSLAAVFAPWVLRSRSLRLRSPSSRRHRRRTERYVVAGWFTPSKTELDKKLDRCMGEINAYTDREIACVPFKWRTLLLGMRAGFKLPKLLDAVRMLYQDIFPLRCGGDFIMNAIAGVIQDGNQNTKASIPDADLIGASALFDVLDRDRSGTISEENLREMGFSASAIADIMHAIDADGNRQIDLFEFLSDHSGDDVPDIFDVLEHQLASADLVKSLSHADIKQIISLTRQASRAEPSESSSCLRASAAVAAASNSATASSGSKPSKHDARFLDILAYIRSLEQKLEQSPVSNQRLKVILDGSIEASQDEDVVEALRFVYNEVGAIRIAGNMIFQIVSRYVGT